MRNDILEALEGMLPFPLFSTGADMTSSKDIVSTLESAGQAATLIAALKSAGLMDTLKGAGPFTMLAPTDAAFAKLPAGTVETLLKPDNKKKLLGILTRHVVCGNVKAAAVMTMSSATTLNGRVVTLSLGSRTVKFDDAAVVKADIVASNGTIHIIDTVLLSD